MSQEVVYKNPKTSGMAITSLIFGIGSCLGFCIFVIPPIVGLVTGILGINKAEKSNGEYTGKGLAITGIITSVMSVFVVGILAAMIMPALSKARAKAQQAQGKTYMKQMGVNLASHMIDSPADTKFPSITVLTNGLPQEDPFFKKTYKYSGETVNGFIVAEGAPIDDSLLTADVNIIVVDGAQEAADNGEFRHAPRKVYTLRGDMSVQ